MKLALFFTSGVSLKTWVDTGLFDREKLIYEEHLKRGHLDRVFWITYGSKDRELAQELQLQKRLHPAIEVIQMPRIFSFKRGYFFYSFLVPFIHRKIFRQSDIIKTNQMNGSWSAVLAKWIHKKPLILRTGFTKSLFLRKNLNKVFIKRLKTWIKIKLYELLEWFCYKYSDVGVVASRQNKEYICEKYHLENDKVQAIFNYIDTKKFKAVTVDKYQDRMIYVGRLTEQKNLFNLIEAVYKTGLSLDIYGKGALEYKLQLHASMLGAKVNFMGVVSNKNLPEILSKYQYYIIPSLYEGMPKALLEAMACGLVCIGTNVAGINEVIEDVVNGVLARHTNAESIAGAIKHALNTDTESLGKKATDKIERLFSLESAVEKELAIFRHFQHDDILK